MALAQLEFIKRAEVLHLLDSPGTAKSHLATAIGLAEVRMTIPRHLANCSWNQWPHARGIRTLCQKDGIAATSRDIRRTINSAILRQPQALKEAVRIAQGHHIRIESNEPIPTEHFGIEGCAEGPEGCLTGLHRSLKSA
jgi:hypothetical protein